LLTRDVVIHIRDVNKTIIERARVVKFFGVYVDDLLNRNYHNIYVKPRLFKTVGIMYTLTGVVCMLLIVHCFSHI